MGMDDPLNTTRQSLDNDLGITFSASINLELPHDPNQWDHLEGVDYNYYLLVTEDITISKAFYANNEVLSLANNFITLMTLPELLVQYDTPIYRVDWANGTLYAVYTKGMKKTSLMGRKHRVRVVEPLADVMLVPHPQPQATSTPAVEADVTLLLGSISNEFT